MFLFFINYQFAQLNNRIKEELSKLLFMCHLYRSSDIYDIMVKLNRVPDNALAETRIQDIREIDNINSIMTLTIADDK